MNMIPALPFRAEPWVEDENFNDAFAWMEEWHNPTTSEHRGSLLAAAALNLMPALLLATISRALSLIWWTFNFAMTKNKR
jgi:hypothetical protein